MHLRAAIVDDGVHSPRGGAQAEPAASILQPQLAHELRRLFTPRKLGLPSINFAEVNCAMADKSVWLNVEDEDAWVLCTVEGSTDSEVNLLRAHAPDGVSTKTAGVKKWKAKATAEPK